MKTFVRWAVVIFLLPLSVSCRDTGRATSGGGVKPLLTAIDDLRGKRIAVQFGTVYDMYATKTFLGATVVQFNTFQEVTLAVSAGMVDAGLSDLDTLNEVRRANDDLVPSGKPIFASEVAAGFAKSSMDLRASFSAFLKSIRENGTHADMVDRWMTRRITRMPEIPSSPANGTLVVGISSGGFPFSAVQDGQLAGFDVELARRFAAYIGRELRLLDHDFGALIPALVSGKIDVIIADMFVTEERRSRSISRSRILSRTRSRSPEWPTRRRRRATPWQWAALHRSPNVSRPAFGATSSPSGVTCCCGTASRRRS